jgi:hypothetical protein
LPHYQDHYSRLGLPGRILPSARLQSRRGVISRYRYKFEATARVFKRTACSPRCAGNRRRLFSERQNPKPARRYIRKWEQPCNLLSPLGGNLNNYHRFSFTRVSLGVPASGLSRHFCRVLARCTTQNRSDQITQYAASRRRPVVSRIAGCIRAGKHPVASYGRRGTARGDQKEVCKGKESRQSKARPVD